MNQLRAEAMTAVLLFFYLLRANRSRYSVRKNLERGNHSFQELLSRFH